MILRSETLLSCLLGGLFLVAASAQGAESTVSLEGFTLSCPATVGEGSTATCTLTNTSDAAKDWPVVGILHLSSDGSRARVAGSPLDLRFVSIAGLIDGGVWWIGDVLVAYSRFDWSGEAPAAASRGVSILIEDDDDYEGEEVFYVSLASSGSRGVGRLYLSRQAIRIAASDSPSSDAQLQDLKISTHEGDVPLSFSSGTTSYTATVAYPVTEAIVDAAVNHRKAQLAVNGQPVEGGRSSHAIPLRAGSTAIDVVVTAESRATETYRVNVIRPTMTQNVEVEVDGFTLVCPSRVAEGSAMACSLTNTNSMSEDWPVVAIIHSSSDGDNRALIAEDSRITKSNPSFGIDIKLSDVQTPARESYNYGYGELFSGGSRSVYTTYGYQKFDWSGQAAAGAERSVVMSVLEDDRNESPEVFYVALAPSGYTGLSKLVDNRVPVVLIPPDTTPPTVASITSNAAHPTKDPFKLTVTFSEAVTGLTLDEIEVSRGTGSNLSGSGTAYTLTVTPETGYEGGVTVTVPSGVAVDSRNNGNLERRQAFAVDTKAPTVRTLSISSDPRTEGLYAAGDVIRVTVTFSELVLVTGTPQLTLEVGDEDRTAIYRYITGTALVFAYTVDEGEDDSTGVSLKAGSIDLNGGMIIDGASNLAVLVHGAVEPQSGHKVDGVRPELAATGGAVVDGTTLTLTYNEPLDSGLVAEPGDFTVDDGDQARTVTRVVVSGTSVELTMDLGAEHAESEIRVSYTPGVNPIRDLPGNEAEALSRVPVSNKTPDTTAPEVSSLAIRSNPGSDQTYAAEDVIEVTVSFSETVEVTGAPRLRLKVGSSHRTAGYLRGTDTEELVFGHEVADGHEDTDGVSIEAGEITLNGGSIADEAGNPGELAHEALPAQIGHKVDGVRPALLTAAVDGSSLTLTYGETLDGGSRPAPGDFTVEVGGAGRSVTGVSVSGSVVTLTLSTAVEHGDTGIRVSYTPRTNPIQDAVGNDARGLSNQAVTNTTGAPNTAPEITTVGPFTVRENQALVRRLAARDDDPGDEVTGWAIVGGADGSQFSITSDTGDLSFQEAPDYESPTDVVSGDPSSGAGDNEYVVTVEVRSGAGARELEAEQTFTVRVTDEREPPGIPEAPAFSGETADSLTVRWSEPENTGPPIMDYDVRYREKGPGHFIDAQHMGPGLSLTLADLEPGTAYEVQVRATNDEGTSDWSDPGEGMTVTPLTVEMMGGTEPPVEGPFTVRFSFSEPVRGFTQAAIETALDPACTDEQNNPVFCEPDIGRLETVDDRVFSTTVTPQTDRVAHNYTLTLTVSGGAVKSSVGNKLNEEAMLGGRVAPPGVILPISEIGLRASGLDRAGRLNWNRPTNDGGSPVIRYEHRHAPVGKVWNDRENVGARATGVTVGNLVNGLEYVFEVRAVNALGKGPVETAAAIPVLRTGPPPGGGGGGGGGPRQTVPDAPRNLLADATDGAVTLMWEAPEDDGGAVITDYEYRIDQRGDWISIGSTATTHTVAGLVNGTTYVFQVRAVNRVGRSGPSLPAEATPIAQVVLDLAHFANGAGIISEVVLVNVAPHPIRPALYFYDQEGEPIAAESMVDVLGDLGIQEDGGLTIQSEMEPLGELTISTHGRGDLVSGSVKVAAYGTIGGVLRFDLPGIGVAGVQVSQPLRDAIFPVRRREGGINTGMALHNREEEAAVVSCRLMKKGAVLEEVEIPLAANGQDSRYIEQMFTNADTSDFVGSVRCTAEGVAQFTGMALELDAGNRIFTTLPVVKVNRGRAGEAALDFAHFANGASIVSEMVFMNLETQPSGPPLSPFHQAIPPTRPVIYFYDTEGNPIDPALLVELTGDLEITEDGALSIQSEMEPLGELTISTHGREELVSGSVRVVSDGPIGGVLRFDLPGIGVAGVGASQPVRDAIFPARRQAGGISTAAAIHNLGEEALVVSCQLMQKGAVLEEEEISLEANGQEARYIEQMFTSTDTSDFVGSVRCTAPPGEGMFTGVAVELDAGNRIFTTLPVVPVPERVSQK